MNRGSEDAEELIHAEFPVPSATSPRDKLVLLGLREIVRACPTYSYAEIGSYLGGSLTPFLRDPKCASILSIDERGRIQPDERGRTYDYTGISHQTMLSTLQSKGLTVDKIEVFDGSVSGYSGGDSQYDLLFIDGEHTDWACFRDFIHGMRLTKEDAIIAFHDSTLIWKSLRLIQEFLNSTCARYEFHKAQGSEVSFLLLGDYASTDVSQFVELDGDLEQFYLASESFLLRGTLRNRIATRSLVQELRRRATKNTRNQVRRARSRVSSQIRRERLRP
jgi:hypothetical protein